MLRSDENRIMIIKCQVYARELFLFYSQAPTGHHKVKIISNGLRGRYVTLKREHRANVYNCQRHVEV